MRKPSPKIIFLNQGVGRLFMELASGLSDVFGCCVIYTCQANINTDVVSPNLKGEDAPPYRRGSAFQRIQDWISYSFSVAVGIRAYSKNSVLFIVSNPPFLASLGYILKKIRHQPYVVLVYDIYPQLAICLKKVKANSIIDKVWRYFNRIVWENASAVITIGEKMAENLNIAFDASQTLLGHIAVISNWADTEFIKPIAKEENWFARKYNLTGKLTVLYSGNLGATHDLGTMLTVAKRLRSMSGLQFIIVGEGFQRSSIEKYISEENQDNVLLLPFQPERDLPYTLGSGDIAVISLMKGAEGLSVPSKVYYALASGAALICVCAEESELTRIVTDYHCGIVVEPGDESGFQAAIEKFYTEPEFLRSCRSNARNTAEAHFGLNNIKKYQELLESLNIIEK